MTPELFQALTTCLSPGPGPGEIAAAARSAGWEALFATAFELRLAPALVWRLREKQALPAVPPLTLADGRRTVTALGDEIWRQHLARSSTLAARLAELVAALGDKGLEPILLKGARSLASGSPPWRSMRDLDLLLAGPEAGAAHQVAMALGYRPAAASAEKAGKHHFQPLFRDDLPGWLEIHRRAAAHRAEALLPTSLLATMTLQARLGPSQVRILTPPAHALHAIVHHHVGHRGDKGGAIDLKGLFEVADDLAALTAPERDQVLALARRHPRLLAMLELYLAAAHVAFGTKILPPFTLHADALERAAGTLARTVAPAGRYAGVLEEMRFAGRRERLLRLPDGATPAGRQLLRLRILGSMFRPMIDPFAR